MINLKKYLLALGLGSALLLGACSDDKEEVEKDAPITLEQEEQKNEQAEAHFDVVEQFIKIAYFDEGAYDDFVALYADPATANTEEEFNNFRETTTAEDQFPVDSDSVEKMLKHLVAVAVDDTHAEVYWVEDKAKATKADAAYVWQLVDVNGAWKIQ